ncbi:ATPase [Pontibacter diazotrophicus]|uniref:histidine kinase n=1 Tax=Pontibacter diazotrophicus TaxID=1400979 RepID=A0A3D8LE86_9BACT|nr:GAF domain-containing sensor histidine kinase [Pontibacter diazotrophicus]RDV15710.1 ATPase [Pontibacter diazotrophicus]
MAITEKLEVERLRALKAFNILDTPAEKEFDDITALAAHICDTPISLITLVTEERQWFKSKVGTEVCELPRSVSFCQHTILQNNILEIEDTLEDERFRQNILVTSPPYIRFYAGAQLLTDNGYNLGSLCVLDTVPRQLTEVQRNALNTLARQVVANFELRLKQEQLEKEKLQLKVANEKLEQFVRMVSHDLKEPIMNISTIIEWLQDDLAAKDFANMASNLLLIKDSAAAMEELVIGLLQYSMTQVKDLPKEEVDVYGMVQGLIAEHSGGREMKTHVSPDLPVLTTEKVLLQQVFANLISNAFKYHHTGKGNLWVSIDEESEKYYTFCVKDDGPGIPLQHQEKVFAMFERLLRDASKKHGSGIGLATVKKIVEDKGGKVWIESDAGQGTTFYFTWPK